MAQFEQPYLSTIASNRTRFPALGRILDFAAHPTSCHAPRLSVLEFTESSVVETKIESLAELWSYWKDHHDGVIRPEPVVCGRLYVVEDVSPAYLDALGFRFNIHPTFFLKHLYLPVRLKGDPPGASARLPLQPLSSSRDGSTGLALRYYDLFRGSPTLDATNVRRKVATIKPFPGEESVATILRNASLYVDSDSDSSAPWFGLMLVDAPALGNPFIAPMPTLNCADIVEQKTQPRIEPLSHDGLFDVVMDYWNNRATQPQIETVNQSPRDALESFLAKSIAPSWLALLEMTASILSSNEYLTFDFEKISVDAPADKIRAEVIKLREALSAVNRVRRRTLWYLDHVRINLRALGHPPGTLDTWCGTDKGARKETTGVDEFAAILEQFRFSIDRADSLLPVVLGACSILGAQQGALESRQVNTLTYLAGLFVPITTVAGVLSMGEGYLPGQAFFWVFWAVAVPMVILVVVLMYSMPWIQAIVSPLPRL